MTRINKLTQNITLNNVRMRRMYSVFYRELFDFILDNNDTSVIVECFDSNLDGLVKHAKSANRILSLEVVEDDEFLHLQLLLANIYSLNRYPQDSDWERFLMLDTETKARELSTGIIDIWNKIQTIILDFTYPNLN